MKLFKYYTKAVIYPSLFILFFCIVFSLLNNYKSDPLSLQSVIQMSILPALVFALLLCVLSLTIFLNKFKKINHNAVWNTVAWFLLPIAYIVIILIHDLSTRIKFKFGFGNDFLYLLIMTIPYVIGLFWTFFKFRSEIAAARFKN